MLAHENECYLNGANLIAGVDEVGRGPLAGPVVACAVILPRDCNIVGINDSKKLSETKRIKLAHEIKQNAVSYAIGICGEKEIDEINILQATFKAMYEAVNGLSVKPEYVLVDGDKTIPQLLDIPQKAIVQGDGTSLSIAAASIIAKVARDEMMCRFHDIYPKYNFGKHKGYGTKDHVSVIKEYGACPIHRMTFLKKIIGVN